MSGPPDIPPRRHGHGRTPEFRTAGAPGLGFQRTDAPRRSKNRMHFDVSAPDPAAEQRRVEALGGRRLEGYDDGLRRARHAPKPVVGPASRWEGGRHVRYGR
ncbi:VOC family protein [Streptomyces rubiginosohelvolus]